MDFWTFIIRRRFWCLGNFWLTFQRNINNSSKISRNEKYVIKMCNLFTKRIIKFGREVIQFFWINISRSKVKILSLLQEGMTCNSVSNTFIFLRIDKENVRLREISTENYYNNNNENLLNKICLAYWIFSS